MAINKEKASYAIQAFILFLNVVKEGRTADLREVALNLLEQVVANRLSGQEASEQLNQLIEQLNETLKAPYPILMTDTDENLVKTEIVAFEHYLNHGLKANQLTIQQEAPLFNESLKLWEKIGTSLSAKEGVTQFSSLIERLNGFLPEEVRYPIPDIKEYETIS